VPTRSATSSTGRWTAQQRIFVAVAVVLCLVALVICLVRLTSGPPSAGRTDTARAVVLHLRG